MKQLQCNFTTPEQSKRLLELGVPAWTADCFCPTDLQQNIIQDATPTIITYQLDTKEIVWDKVYGFPCWSVGRLIEIMCINDIYFDYGGDSYRRGYNIIDYIISQLEAEDDLDFSELE